jgi:hypothetical protein
VAFFYLIAFPRYPLSPATHRSHISRSPHKMSELTACGWVDLPKCRKRCWFAQLPPAEELQNYITIMDDFGVNLEQTGQTFQHLMMW